MDFTFEPTLNPRPVSTIYSLEDVPEGALPSLVFSPDDLGDLSLFLTMPPLRYKPGPLWALENFSYSFNAPHVYEDGRLEGALHPPEFYAYSPLRMNAWDDGMRAIDDFDWSVAQDFDVMEATPEKDHTTPQGNLIDSRAPEILYAQVAGSIRENQVSTEGEQDFCTEAPGQITNETPAIGTSQPPCKAEPFKSFDIDTAKSILPIPMHVSELTEELTLAEDGITHHSDSVVPAKESAPEPEAEPERNVDFTMADVDTEDQSHRPGTDAPTSNLVGGAPLSRSTSHPDKHATAHSSKIVDFAGETVHEQEVESAQNADMTMQDVDVEYRPLPSNKTTPAPRSPIQKSLALPGLAFPPTNEAGNHSSYLIAPADLDSICGNDTETAPDDQYVTRLKATIYIADPSIPSFPDVVEGSSNGITFPDLSPSVPEPNFDASLDLMDLPAQTFTHSQIQSSIDGLSSGQELKAPSREAGAKGTTDHLSELFPGYQKGKVRVGLPETKVSLGPDQVLPSVEEGLNSRNSQIDALSEDYTKCAAARKRTKSVQVETSSDTDAEAPAKKKQKNEETDTRVVGHGTGSSTHGYVHSTLPAVKLKHRPARKSVKESSKQISDDSEVPKPAQTYFEEQTRPFEDRPAELNRAEEDIEQPMDEYDFDMQEFYVDVQDIHIINAPTSSQRSGRNTVSNHEFESLESTLAPGMHLGLHIQPDYMPSCARKRPETPRKNPMADNMVFVGEGKPSEEKSASTASTNKGAGTAFESKAVQSQRVRASSAKTNSQSRSSRSKRSKAEAGVAGEEEGQELFPALMLDAAESLLAGGGKPTPVPVKIVSTPQKAIPRSKKTASTGGSQSSPHDLGYGKRHTRGDTKLDDAASRFTSTTPSVVTHEGAVEEPDVDEPQAKSEDDADEDYSEPRIQIPRPKKDRKASHLSLPKGTMTSRAGTTTPSITSTSSSLAVKNKFGFLPRITRSAAATKAPAHKGKGKAPDRRSLRRASTLAPEAAATSRAQARNAPTKSKQSIIPKEPERRSARCASSVAPDAAAESSAASTSASAKSKDVQIEALEEGRRTTRRILAVEVEEKETNVGRRLRSGNQAA